MPSSIGAPSRATRSETPGPVRRPRPHDPTVDAAAPAACRCRAARPLPFRCLGALALGVLAAACQSYERRPLDLEDHLALMSSARPDPGALATFVERLAEDGHDVPERFDLADGLTAAEAEVLALFHNPDLRLARLEVDVALAGREHAGLWEDPVFGFDAAQVLSPGSLLEYGLTLGVTLPLSGQLDLLEDLADARVEAQLRAVVDAEWRLRLELRRAWTAWSVARERAQLVDQVVEQLRGVATVTERLVAAGELSRIQGRLVPLALLERELQSIDLVAAADRRRIDVLALLGLASDVALELLPELRQQPATFDAGAGETGVLLAHNTRVALARARYRSAEEALRLEIRAQYPDLGLAAGYGDEDDRRFLLGLSLPIPLWNRNRAAIATARAERELARAVAETEAERALVELALARTRLTAARAARERLVDEALPALEAQMEEAARLVELGEVDLFALLETATRRYELHASLLDQVFEEAEAAATIVELLGPVPDGGRSGDRLDDPADDRPTVDIDDESNHTTDDRTGDAPNAR